jgi:hypothetical protein
MNRLRPAPSAPSAPSASMRAVVRYGVGPLFLWSSGVHVGIVAADPQLYRDVADAAWFPGVRTAWQDVFMAHPSAWGLAVAGGELAIGVLVSCRGRSARLGVAAAIAFHIGLMTLGWGYWSWAVPALAVLWLGRPPARETFAVRVEPS